MIKNALLAEANALQTEIAQQRRRLHAHADYPRHPTKVIEDVLSTGAAVFAMVACSWL